MEDGDLEEVPLSPRSADSPRVNEERPTIIKEIEYNVAGLVKNYQKELNVSFTKFQVLLKSKDWEYIRVEDENEIKIKLYEQTSANDGYYYLKVTGLLKVNAKKVLDMNIDNCFTTRKTWDNPELVSIEQLETYENSISLVRSRIRAPKMAVGVWDRDFTGIQWHRYNQKQKKYTVIFKTVDHPIFKTPSDTVKAFGFTGITIQELDYDECYVNLIVYLHPGGWMPSQVVKWAKYRLRERVMLYEEVGKNWEKYYGKRESETGEPRVVGEHNNNYV